MGLFDRIFQPNKANEGALTKSDGLFQELRGYEPVFRDHHGRIYEEALVRMAIDARARHISKLSVQMTGTSLPALKSKMQAGPNQWQTWSQFLYRTSTILDVQNTVFVVPVFDESLRITGYYPVLPLKCEIVQFEGEPWLRYTFSRNQKAAVELRKCAVLTKFQYEDDFFGDTNRALDDTMKMISVQNTGIEEAVKNSASYRFMARTNNFTKTEDLKKERERFSSANLKKDSGGGGILLFPNTYTDIRQIEAKPYTVDAEQMKLINGNVEKYFGVNEKVMKNEATGDELDAFFNGAIEPFAIQFSDAMTKAIYSERERATGSRVLATANRLQYMSISSKVEMAQQMLDRGVMTINEARELFNYEPIEGGDVAPIRGEYKEAQELGGNDNANENE